MLPFLARLRLLPTIWRSGRLALALFRDPRTPWLPKVLLAAAVVYAVSPLDLVPDLVPVLGQLDDVAILALGLELFFKNVPDWLLREHETRLGRTAKGQRVIDAPAPPSRPQKRAG